jgi:hypothetical protein
VLGFKVLPVCSVCVLHGSISFIGSGGLSTGA